jgi:hypothetical protein
MMIKLHRNGLFYGITTNNMDFIYMFNDAL